MLDAQNAIFGMSTHRETFVPLIYCVIDDILSTATPDFRQTLLHFNDVMNLMRSQMFPFSGCIRAKRGHFSI